MKNPTNFYDDLTPFLSCKDYTVSDEIYELNMNSNYEMLVTFPVPNDLSKYYKSESYISHTDSKKSLFDKVYQVVKNASLNKKLQLINSFNTSSKNVLDIGAGTGDFLKVCSQNNWSIFGTEPNKKARNIAKEKGVELFETLSSVSDKKFDVITLWHVLEHVENLSETIFLLDKILAENGKIIIAVPNFKCDDANHYKEFWAAFDVPRHLWHFSQRSIVKVFASVNMTIEKTLPMKFDAFYVSLLSEKYKSGKMNIFRGFYRGLISNWKAKKTSEYSSLIYVLKKQ